MRILVLCFIAALLGVSFGLASTWSSFHGVQERFDLDEGTAHGKHDHSHDGHNHLHATPKQDSLQATDGARVEVVNGASFDFKEMERFTKRSHNFILKNPGTAILKLENGGTSC